MATDEFVEHVRRVFAETHPEFLETLQRIEGFSSAMSGLLWYSKMYHPNEQASRFYEEIKETLDGDSALMKKYEPLMKIIAATPEQDEGE
jgi:hypothetical protein